MKRAGANTLLESAESPRPELSRQQESGVLTYIKTFLTSSFTGAISVAFLLAMVLMAIFADLLAPYPPLQTNYGNIGGSPSSEHLLGTDLLGRDVLSRIIHGSRVTLLVGITAVVLADTIGFAWGLLSGYTAQRFDLVSQRVLDVLLAFPTLILALLLVVSMGPGLFTVIIAIALAQLPLSTRSP
jgi:peptide/nickel transport system permease protein